MHIFNVRFILGVCIGIELFLGDDLEEDDKFAITIDLLILRFTYIITK